MPRTKKADLYIAKESFWTETDEGPVFVQAGERIRDGHDLLRKYPQYFEPADTTVRYDVEQATAAPGETR